MRCFVLFVHVCERAVHTLSEHMHKHVHCKKHAHASLSHVIEDELQCKTEAGIVMTGGMPRGVMQSSK